MTSGGSSLMTSMAWPATWVMMRCLSINGMMAACGNRLLSMVWHIVQAIFRPSDFGEPNSMPIIRPRQRMSLMKSKRFCISRKLLPMRSPMRAALVMSW